MAYQPIFQNGGVEGMATEPHVDRMLGNAYQVVRYVAQKMHHVQRLSTNMQSLVATSNSLTEVAQVAAVRAEVVALYAHLTELVSIYPNMTALLAVQADLADLLAVPTLSAENLRLASLRADAALASEEAALQYAEDASGFADQANATRQAIDNRTYPGTSAVDPTIRPDGTARQTGDRYYNSATQTYKTFNGTVWFDPETVAIALRNSTETTAKDLRNSVEVTARALRDSTEATAKANRETAANLVLAGIGYAPPVLYTAGLDLTLPTQTVEYADEKYAPVFASLPFTTSGTFEASKFRLIQGVAAVDLAGSGGAGMVGANAYQTQNAVNLESISVKRFGAQGDGVTDNTLAIQAALNAHKKVYLPAGVYLTKILRLNTGNEFFGAGAASILRSFDSTTASQYILATHAYGEGTSNPAQNKRDIYVHDLMIDARMQEFGNQPFYHAMTINATTNMLVERVTFYDFRGDGCYLGSGNNGGIERHNVNIAFRDCIFDGVSKNNRNGLSVIDCDKLRVSGCVFKNIGNVSLSNSVGAIDFEPNANYSIYRDVVIEGCTFSDVDSVNTAGISLFNGAQLNDNIHSIKIVNNYFVRCYRGISWSSVAKTPSSLPDNVLISGNSFLNSTLEDINNFGHKGVVITENTFALYPVGSTSYRGGIGVGLSLGGLCRNAIGTEISGNTFNGLRPQFSCVSIRGAIDLVVSRNKFFDITGSCISSLTSATAGVNRCLSGIIIENNTAQAQSAGAVTPTCTGLLVNTAGIGTEFINATCIARGNVVHGNVLENRAAALALFRELPTAVAPAAGTWAVGNYVPDTVPLAGAAGFACSVAGTFGTLSGVTGDVTTGSNILTNVVDAVPSLREDQYILVAGDASVKKIILINGTSVYLSANTTAPTGAGVVLSWTPPTFVAV